MTSPAGITGTAEQLLALDAERVERIRERDDAIAADQARMERLITVLARRAD